MKTNHWRYWKTKPLPGPLNMALDELCLQHANQHNTPLLRSYQWQTPTATFGCLQPYQTVTTLTNLRPLIRRPTGGGIVPHQNDWTYSIILPTNHPWRRARPQENYQQLHTWLQTTFTQLAIPTQLNQPKKTNPNNKQPTHCFTQPQKNDLLHNHKKLAGAAQRRNRHGLLIQGSIQPPPTNLNRTQWETTLRQTATQLWNIQWQTWHPTTQLLQQAQQLATQKYANPNHTQKP